MLFTALIRNLLLIFTVSLSLIFFVSCQREVDEILEESPEPDPDSSGKRLKAVYLLETGGSQDTFGILQFKYDNLGRLISLEDRSLGDNMYVKLSLYYQGSDRYACLIIDSTSDYDDYQAIDSTFIFYDPLGRISHDSTISWRTNFSSWPDFYLDYYIVQSLTYIGSNSVKTEWARQWFDGQGGLGQRVEDVISIDILQNSINVFELDYELRQVGGNYPEYRKIEFSQYHNPFKGLFPPYPYLLSESFQEMEGDFPYFPSRVLQDRADVFVDNYRHVVESHIDSFPTRVRREFYNFPGWVDTLIFEYE